jgi:hypothetical protein
MVQRFNLATCGPVRPAYFFFCNLVSLIKSSYLIWDNASCTLYCLEVSITVSCSAYWRTSNYELRRLLLNTRKVAWESQQQKWSLILEDCRSKTVSIMVLMTDFVKQINTNLFIIVLLLLMLLFTWWYRTSRPIHCDNFWSTVLPHLSSNHSWLIHPISGTNQQRYLVAKQEKLGETYPWILPPSRPISFALCKVSNVQQNLKTRDQRLYIPSKGSHSADFYLP